MRKRPLPGLFRWIPGLAVLFIAAAASAQPCCECRCPGNQEPACSEDFGLDEDAYLVTVCEPLGCSISVCTDKACAQANRCPRNEDGRCSDGFDNDADGAIDCDDVDCAGADFCTGGPGGDDCCVGRDVPGCAISACESCVCGRDAFCCDATWDVNCGFLAQAECADVCECGAPPAPTPTPDFTPTAGGSVVPTSVPTTDTTPTPSEGSPCCVDRDVGGCGIPACEDCVCGLDDFCCNATWDVNCAFRANADCAGECECEVSATPTPVGSPGPPSNCCTGRPSDDGPGCSLAACQSCVCNIDGFCCAEFWDQTCADIAGAGCLADCACDTAPPLPTETPTRLRPSRAPTTPPPVPTTPAILCTSPASCPPGFVCSSSGRCVAPSPTRNGGGGGGGCAIRTPTGTGVDFAWLVLPLLLRWIAGPGHRRKPEARRNDRG